jgi:hypothetical protein
MVVAHLTPGQQAAKSKQHTQYFVRAMGKMFLKAQVQARGELWELASGTGNSCKKLELDGSKLEAWSLETLF